MFLVGFHVQKKATTVSEVAWVGVFAFRAVVENYVQVDIYFTQSTTLLIVTSRIPCLYLGPLMFTLALGVVVPCNILRLLLDRCK